MPANREGFPRYNVSRYFTKITKKIFSRMSPEFELLSLGRGQYMALLHIYKKEGISQNELCDHCGFEKDEGAKAIKSLMDQGYVTKQVNRKDKRVHNIFLTDKAMEVKKDFQKILIRMNEVLLHGFSKEERTEVLGYMERILENVSNKS